jgi:hypothetical protein
MAAKPIEITVVELPFGGWSAFVGGEAGMQEQGSFPTAAVGTLIMSYPSRFGIKIVTPEPLKGGPR